MSEVVLAFARRATAGSLPAIELPADETLFLNTRGEPDAVVVAGHEVSRHVLERAMEPALSMTSFARCRPIGTLPAPSEKRPTRGLLIGATDCGDETALPEFHSFYDRIHAQEVLDSGVYWRARRFERIRDGRDESLPRFFALYDTERSAADAYRALRRHPMTTDWPEWFLVRGVWCFDAV
jgi:hypothetical protein